VIFPEALRLGSPVSGKNSSRKLMNNRPYEGQKVRRDDLPIVLVIRGSTSDRLGWGLEPRGPRSSALSNPGGTRGRRRDTARFS